LRLNTLSSYVSDVYTAVKDRIPEPDSDSDHNGISPRLDTQTLEIPEYPDGNSDQPYDIPGELARSVGKEKDLDPYIGQAWYDGSEFGVRVCDDGDIEYNTAVVSEQDLRSTVEDKAHIWQQVREELGEE
jgi:hypothetical protein